MNMINKTFVMGSVALLVGANAWAGDWAGELRAGGGYWAGDATYSIGGEAWTPEDGAFGLPDKISELKFPLDVPFGSVGGSLTYKGMLEFRGELMANLGDPSTKTTDSDFGVFSEDAPGRLDIYSETDSELSAFAVDMGARYWVQKPATTNRCGWAVGIGPGLTYQRSDWTLSNLDQWYPSVPFLGHDTQAGEVATYTTEILMLYGDIRGVLRYKKLSGSLELGVGPAVVQDEDDHLLRHKLSTAEMAGAGAKGALEVRYDFTRHVYAAARLTALSVMATGTQVQEGYGGDLTSYYAEIDEEFTFTSVTGGLSLGYGF